MAGHCLARSAGIGPLNFDDSEPVLKSTTWLSQVDPERN